MASDNRPFIWNSETIPYKDNVAIGNYTGRSTVNKFGFNVDVDTGANEIIASFGGAFDPKTAIITTAQTLTITYNSTTDGAGTTGARILRIQHLDGDFNLAEDDHILGNDGSDVTSFTTLGINRVIVLTNGGAGWNVNDITLTATDDTTVQAQVPALDGVTQQILYHTPINHTLLMDYLWLNVRRVTSGGQDVRYTWKVYSWSRVVTGRFEVFRLDGTTRTSVTESFQLAEPFIFTGREVIWYEITTSIDNTIVNGRFSATLVDNNTVAL